MFADYKILGENELVHDKKTGSHTFQLDGQTDYNSKIILLGNKLAPNSTGIIPLKGQGDIEAYSVIANQYIPTTKPKELEGFLDLKGIATRTYTDGLSYHLNCGYVLPNASKYRKAINKKFDEQGVFGLGEDQYYNSTGTKRDPNSIFAKATKGFSSGIDGIREAIDAIHEYGGSPVVLMQNMLSFNYKEFSQVSNTGVWKDAMSDALWVSMQGLQGLAKRFDANFKDSAYIVFDRNRLFYSNLGDVFMDISNSAYDPYENFTGNTGKGDIDNPATSTGVSYFTNDKIGHRAIAYLDYAYLGDENTAFTNIPELQPAP